MNWQTPQELPDLRRVGIVALDTEENDEGLRHARRVWGRREAASITRQDVARLLFDVVTRGPVLANRLRSVLLKMYSWASDAALLDATSASDLHREFERGRAADRAGMSTAAAGGGGNVGQGIAKHLQAHASQMPTTFEREFCGSIVAQLRHKGILAARRKREAEKKAARRQQKQAVKKTPHRLHHPHLRHHRHRLDVTAYPRCERRRGSAGVSYEP